MGEGNNNKISDNHMLKNPLQPYYCTTVILSTAENYWWMLSTFYEPWTLPSIDLT